MKNNKQFAYVVLGFLVLLQVIFVLVYKNSDSFKFKTAVNAPWLVDFFDFSMISSYEASLFNPAENYFNDLEKYDLDKSEFMLNTYAALKEKAERRSEALYLLSRIYLAQGELDKSLATVDALLNEGVVWDRAYYIKGLALAYNDQLDEAYIAMERFVKDHPEEWAGYLDLSWILFQKGKTVEAGENLELGLQRHPKNPWLLSAYGVIQYNYQNKELAEKTLLQAQVEAEKITPELWRNSYTANNPANIELEIEQFKNVIKYNLGLVNANYEMLATEINKAFESPFADVGARGAEGGLHVSACASGSCHGGCAQVCNQCGSCQCSYDHGTGQCSNGAPALPGGYNSTCKAINRCAQNEVATIGCDGNCNLTVPEAPIPSVSGSYRVEAGERIYFYEPSKADVCYLFTNNNADGNAVFVPARSLAEYSAFVGADIVTVPGTGYVLDDITTNPGVFDANGNPI